MASSRRPAKTITLPPPLALALAEIVPPGWIRQLKTLFAQTGADEGSVWLADKEEDCLVMIFNSGPRAKKLCGFLRQPLREGLISLVYLSEQPMLDNDVQQNRHHSKFVDTFLGQHTNALMAAPWYSAGELRGIVSCVQLRRTGAPPPPFAIRNLASLQELASLLGSVARFPVSKTN